MGNSYILAAMNILKVILEVLRKREKKILEISVLYFRFLLNCHFVVIVWVRSIGEGNGTPLRYSCLENPMDGGAW